LSNRFSAKRRKPYLATVVALKAGRAALESILNIKGGSFKTLRIDAQLTTTVLVDQLIEVLGRRVSYGVVGKALELLT